MSLTYNEFWTILHGLILGSIYLLAFSGGIEGFLGLEKEKSTDLGFKKRLRRLYIGTTAMALISWFAVISGTFIVYPWYRAKLPPSPRLTLLANTDTAGWHNFAMEWKEHVAWFAPILATVAAYLVIYYGKDLVKHKEIRKIIFAIFILAFASAAIAGLCGAFINKAAPVM